MKVSEYIPLYGLLFNFEYQTGMEGKAMTVNELFDNYPDFELTDTHLDQLYYFDLASLQTALKDEYFTPENVTTYLRRLFDSYREAGGNPFEWLHGTFESVNLNPQNYKVELRATLEKTLIEWIEIFKKQPIDSLYYYTNPEALPPQPIVKQKPIKYGANEYALTYIFDLYAIGQQVPINRIEGSFDAKKIKQDASKFTMYDKAPDTFYRAVKSVLEYDLNKPTDLQNISKDWLNAVRNLSTNWVITEQYLKDKNLIGE